MRRFVNASVFVLSGYYSSLRLFVSSAAIQKPTTKVKGRCEIEQQPKQISYLAPKHKIISFLVFVVAGFNAEAEQHQF